MNLFTRKKYKRERQEEENKYYYTLADDYESQIVKNYVKYLKEQNTDGKLLYDLATLMEREVNNCKRGD